MAVRLRLTRIGAKKSPFYRVVAVDGAKPRDTRFLEFLGHYDPSRYPESLILKEEKIQRWIARGAQPSDTVKKLMREKGLLKKEA